VEGYVQEVNDTSTQLKAVDVLVDISDASLSGFTPNVGDRVEIFGLYDAASGIVTATAATTDVD